MEKGTSNQMIVYMRLDEMIRQNVGVTEDNRVCFTSSKEYNCIHVLLFELKRERNIYVNNITVLFDTENTRIGTDRSTLGHVNNQIEAY